VNDCVTSYFCNQCVLMHTDREMGARNGQLNLRTSPAYKETQIIKLQPLPTQDMRYLSAAEFCAGHGTDDAANTRRSPRARPPTGFKKQTTVSARQHQLKEVINASGIDHVICPLFQAQSHNWCVLAAIAYVEIDGRRCCQMLEGWTCTKRSQTRQR